MSNETYTAELCENCIYTHFVGEPLDGYTDAPLTKLAANHTITVEYGSNHFNPGHCDGCELSLGHSSQDVIITEWGQGIGMSNYTKKRHSTHAARELPDLWSPFALNKYSDDNAFITPLDGLDVPYSGMCYTDGSGYITEYDSNVWEAVSGLTSRSSDIQHPSETIEGSTLLGLEPGIYQCVIVDMLNCPETHCPLCSEPIDYCLGHGDTDMTDMEDGECDCDLVAGWSLLKLDQDGSK